VEIAIVLLSLFLIVGALINMKKRLLNPEYKVPRQFLQFSVRMLGFPIIYLVSLVPSFAINIVDFMNITVPGEIQVITNCVGLLVGLYSALYYVYTRDIWHKLTSNTEQGRVMV